MVPSVWSFLVRERELGVLGYWIFLALGDWSAWVRQWALGRLGSASIA